MSACRLVMGNMSELEAAVDRTTLRFRGLLCVQAGAALRRLRCLSPPFFPFFFLSFRLFFLPFRFLGLRSREREDLVPEEPVPLDTRRLRDERPPEELLLRLPDDLEDRDEDLEDRDDDREEREPVRDRFEPDPERLLLRGLGLPVAGAAARSCENLQLAPALQELVLKYLHGDCLMIAGSFVCRNLQFSCLQRPAT